MSRCLFYDSLYWGILRVCHKRDDLWFLKPPPRIESRQVAKFFNLFREEDAEAQYCSWRWNVEWWNIKWWLHDTRDDSGGFSFQLLNFFVKKLFLLILTFIMSSLSSVIKRKRLRAGAKLDGIEWTNFHKPLKINESIIRWFMDEKEKRLLRKHLQTLRFARFDPHTGCAILNFRHPFMYSRYGANGENFCFECFAFHVLQNALFIH